MGEKGKKKIGMQCGLGVNKPQRKKNKTVAKARKRITRAPWGGFFRGKGEGKELLKRRLNKSEKGLKKGSCGKL